MAEIMGGGLNEFPFFRFAEEHMGNMFQQRLGAADLPEALRSPAGWPEELRREHGDDQGIAAAREHRRRTADAMRTLRAAIDDFAPDIVLIWSKEQMENFGPTAMPPFCIYCYDEVTMRPHERLAARLGDTIWGEGADTELRVLCHREGGRYLTSALARDGFDMAYAYEPLNVPGLAHTFEGLITHLDWDRRGFPYPVLPFYVNAYGHRHLSAQGWGGDGAPDPPAPTPQRCFDLGAATARALRDSPWRVALIAGSSWSHAAVCPKHDLLYPDVASDQALFERMQVGDYEAFRDLDPAELVYTGRQEVLSWVCLAGAMRELGLAPTFADIQPTWMFNSTKVTAVFG